MADAGLRAAGGGQRHELDPRQPSSHTRFSVVIVRTLQLGSEVPTLPATPFIGNLLQRTPISGWLGCRKYCLKPANLFIAVVTYRPVVTHGYLRSIPYEIFWSLSFVIICDWCLCMCLLFELTQGFSTPGFWYFQQKGLFSWFRVEKNEEKSLWFPLEKFWRNPLVPPPGINPSDAHARCKPVLTDWMPNREFLVDWPERRDKTFVWYAWPDITQTLSPQNFLANPVADHMRMKCYTESVYHQGLDSVF